MDQPIASHHRRIRRIRLFAIGLAGVMVVSLGWWVEDRRESSIEYRVGHALEYTRRQELQDAAGARELARFFETVNRVLFKREPTAHDTSQLLELLGPEAIPVLINVLKADPSPAVRVDAAQALSEQDDIRAISALTNALRDRDESVGELPSR